MSKRIFHFGKPGTPAGARDFYAEHQPLVVSAEASKAEIETALWVVMGLIDSNSLLAGVPVDEPMLRCDDGAHRNIRMDADWTLANSRFGDNMARRPEPHGVNRSGDSYSAPCPVKYKMVGVVWQLSQLVDEETYRDLCFKYNRPYVPAAAKEAPDVAPSVAGDKG